MVDSAIMVVFNVGSGQIGSGRFNGILLIF